MSNEFDKLEKKLNQSSDKRGGNGWIWLIIGAVVFAIAIGLLMQSSGKEPPEETAVASPTTETEETSIPTATATAVPPTETAEPTETAVPATNTPSPTETTIPATNTPSPTETPEPTETAVPPTITPSPSEPTIAGGGIRNQNAALFICPDANSVTIGAYLEVDQEADEILGRSSNNNWVYIESNGTEGWVSKSYITIENFAIPDLDETDLEDTDCGEPTPTTIIIVEENTPTTSDLVAYWNASATSGSNGDGTWKTVFTVRVPQGGNYNFQVGELATTSSLKGSSNAQDEYLVTVTGMSCVGPLVERMTITRNGAILQIVRDGTSEVSPNIFIAEPQC